MNIDSHLSWGLVLIAVGWVCIAMLVQGCGGDPFCGPPAGEQAEAYIVGGEPSTLVRSTVHVRGGGYCTGTVIGPHTVLTAAHCEGLTHICLNFYDTCFEIEENIEHPRAIKPGARDVRLLFSRWLPAFQLPSAPLGSADGCSELTAQGYGIGSDGVLQERQVWACEQSSGIILATEAICNGDSGGPLYCTEDPENPTLVGVSSFGFGEPGVCDGATGFVDLTDPAVVAWIEENVR